MQPNKPLLRTENVEKVYRMGAYEIHALRGISLDIYNGEFLSITGKSGSGKSTLMHTLGLLDTPTNGRVLLHDEDVSKMEESELAKVRNREIGFVFQSFNLLERTSTLDNVILPLRYSAVPRSDWETYAREVIDQVGLSDRLYNKSNELSGGQKQRVAIARALVNKPSIILADEPTGNLDSNTGDEIFILFRKLHNEGKTIILVTHDEELADKADRKIVLKDGYIEFDGLIKQ